MTKRNEVNPINGLTGAQEWWVYELTRLDRSLRKPPAEPKRRSKQRTKTARLMSPRQRIAFSQTDDAVKAIFNGDRNPTPTVNPDEVDWWDGSTQEQYHHGKSTATRNPTKE